MSKEELSREEFVVKVNEILSRDMPGWQLAENDKINKERTFQLNDMYLVSVKNRDGSMEKAVVIADGKVIGGQG